MYYQIFCFFYNLHVFVRVIKGAGMKKQNATALQKKEEEEEEEEDDDVKVWDNVINSNFLDE